MTRYLLIALLACSLLGRDGLAQDACYAENDGPQFENGASTATAWFGVRIVPDVTVTITDLQLFTGEVAGQMGVGLWSHDAMTDEPGAPLGEGSFNCQLANDWQGSTLAPNVDVVSGTTYWLIWKTISGAQGSQDPPNGSLGQPFKVSLDDGTSWSPQVIQSTDRVWKFRLLCGCGGGAPAAYGVGCDGSGGFVPALDLESCAVGGQPVSITLNQALGGSFATFFFGLSPGSTPVGGGCDLLVAPPLLPLTITLPLGGVGPGQGNAMLFGVIPPSASGITLDTQAFVADAGVGRGFSASNGLELMIQ